MSEALISWFMTNLGGKVGKEAIIFIISMVPILELRGGLLAAGPALLNVPMWTAIPVCIIGNLIPIPFILLLITPIFNWMKGTKHLKPFVERMEARAMKKSDQIEKYGIPLPGTGAWTGALIASLVGVKFRKAFPAIICGVLLASVIMTILSYTVLGTIFA